MHFLDNIYKTIEELRTQNVLLSRYGTADAKGAILSSKGNICYGDLSSHCQKKGAKYIFTVWYGDTPDVNRGKTYDGMEHTQYRPGPQSDKWLRYLLDPKRSPWKAIHPFIVNNDFEDIRKSGFILEMRDELPYSLLFNFFIATRWAYEFSYKFATMERLMGQGVDPTVAYLVATSFKMKEEVKRTLVRDAGYRKEGRFFIKDAYGDKQWFPAEYKEDERKVFDEVTPIMGHFHEPLQTLDGYARLILSGVPVINGLPKAVTGNKGLNEAWDIFLTDKDRNPGAIAKLKGKPVADAIKFVESFR